MPRRDQAEAAVMAPRRPRAIYWLISIALSAVLLYYSLRGVEWLRVWELLKSASLPVVAAALAILSLDLLLRALRWRVLLSAEGKVTFPDAFWATAAGYLGNNLLPARAGEVIRTLMINKRTKLSRAFVLTTALSERVVDALALITISATVLLTVPEQPGWLASAAKPFGVVALLGVAAIAVVPAFESFWFRILSHTPVPPKIRDFAEHGLRQGLRGIRSFHDGPRLSKFLALTGIIWFLDAMTTVIGAYAIGVSISLPVAFLLVAGLGLGSALPSTPGYVGIYQFVAVSVLTPFGHSRSDAIAYILLFQAMTYIVVLGWGSAGLWRARRAPEQIGDAGVLAPEDALRGDGEDNGPE